MAASDELLNDLLEGAPPTTDQLDELLARRPPEDLRLDFKHGDLLGKAKGERNRELRAAVAGFANAEGGTLVVGVTDPKHATPWTITGLPNKGSPEEWTARALGPLAPHLVPSPVIRTVDHPKGTVLIVAVAHAPNLVPCYEDGSPRYYLRIGDQTLAIDPYLHADLVLGRRQRPLLTVDGRVKVNVDGSEVMLDWEFEVANESLVWADDVRLGLIGYWTGLAAQRPAPRQALSVPAHLRRAVHLARVDDFDRSAVDLRMRTFPLDGDPASLPALGHGTSQTRFLIPPAIDRVAWTGALYVVSRNSIPLWAEARVAFHRNTGEEMQDVFRGDPVVVTQNRPTVWWGAVETFAAMHDDGEL